jgi:hypothetical protein
MRLFQSTCGGVLHPAMNTAVRSKTASDNTRAAGLIFMV